MQIDAYSTDVFVLPLPDGHRFPMEKYRLLRESIETWPQIRLQEPPAATDQQLHLAHSPVYVQALVCNRLSDREQRLIGFPWSPEMVERSRRSTGATIAAAESAWSGRHGRGAVPVAFNLAGGTHHAGPAKGEGFCCFNDAAVAARVMQQRHGLGRIAILDLDVHQGNGTAEIFAMDPSVLTVSVHGARNYPFLKPASDLDIALPDGTRDDPYLEAVEAALDFLAGQGPIDLLIYLAGADPLDGDRLGRLAVSLTGLSERDRRVFCWARMRQVPVAVAMAGGYARPIERTVEVHRQTVERALDIFVRNHG
jgi:acetoin utilization deacetylase AcuC-like enzyme